MAGLLFELHPSSSANQCNFLRCTNDITMTFWYIYRLQIYKKTQTTSSPGYSSLWFNPTFKIQNMGNKAFQYASFWNAKREQGLQLPLGWNTFQSYLCSNTSRALSFNFLIELISWMCACLDKRRFCQIVYILWIDEDEG